MRILREEAEIKEALPVSFITDMISKGWDEVGYLKEASVGIKETYTETAKVEEFMQGLMDAYLVFIGQLELYLHSEENITTETATEPESTSAKESKPELPAAKIDLQPVADAEEDDNTIETDTIEDDIEVIAQTAADSSVNAPESTDPFEFFVDFDEPDMSTPSITEEELYGDAEKRTK